MHLRPLWDSYPGRIVWGSVSLFVVLPLITCALGQGYTLGVYIGTGIAVLWYTVETYYLRQETARGIRNAWTANQAGLLTQILTEHDNLAEDRDVIRAWWREHSLVSVGKYEQALVEHEYNAAEIPLVHDSRRRVSQYFLRLRALCEKGMIDPELVARTLQDEA